MSSPTQSPLPSEDPIDFPTQSNTNVGRNEGDCNSGRLEQYVADAIQNVQEDESMEDAPNIVFQKYKDIVKKQGEEDDASTIRPISPAGSTSTHGDSPSVHGSIDSYASSSIASRLSPSLRNQSQTARSFERRFQSRLGAASPLGSPSDGSSGSSKFLHLRTSSSAPSRIGDALDSASTLDDNETPAPWEVMRWTRLRKVTQQAFSESARRNYGVPTCIAVSSTIVLGTSKGVILVFDYNQNLKAVVGLGTKAPENGAITAIAVSQDHTTIAGGHVDGTIYTYELAKPGRAFLTIPPADQERLEARKVDGHVGGVSVIHLGFLGTRHTALVSADERGMAFSHLANRGFGAAGRTVKTTRLLGRYPFDTVATGKPRKPSSVLGFAVLPLGNVAQPTDSLGLVAMLTPYLLVIVSTTPIAQTHFKANRPRDITMDVPLSGVLAWFPAIKAKEKCGKGGEPPVLNAMLAYSWSNVLVILEVTIEEEERPAEAERPPVLQFRTKARWKCDEAIVAIQWLSRQILTVLTSTQRLYVLEGTELRVTESFDLMSKHIMHHPTFAPILSSLVASAEEDLPSSYKSVADAFYNSFKVYKGKLFLLGSFDVAIGALSNWADRLLAMMDVGDYIGAIKLATAYYTGEVERLTIGLPDDPRIRQPMVEEKLIELMDASLRYVFGSLNNKGKEPEDKLKEQLRELVAACFPACLQLGRQDYILENVFEKYEEVGQEGIVLEMLEQYILAGEIDYLPPTVVKALVSHYTMNSWEERLEEMLCLLDTQSMDVDQLTSLCRSHKLYDALIYIWNNALGDYVTPLIHLLNLLLPLMRNDEVDASNAVKIFPYLAYIFTGRIYPKGDALDPRQADDAKASLYYFLFIGRAVTWRMYSSDVFYTVGPQNEPSFPYLRLLLKFDTPSFLVVMNEAFEDPFLNGSVDAFNGARSDIPEDQVFGRSVNRQYILSILLEVLNPNDFASYDMTYLDMFVARNLPKFPQYLLLSGSLLHKSLQRLCSYPDESLAEESQLSVEYLLSVHKPPDVDETIALLTQARFYRVLRSVLKGEKRFARLLEIYFEDEDAQDEIFDCIRDCLRSSSGLNDRQRRECKEVIERNSTTLIDINIARTTRTLEEVASDLHSVVLKSIKDRPRDQYDYLRELLEPERRPADIDRKRTSSMRDASFIELYLRHMCRFDSERVPAFVETLHFGDINLEEVLPSIEGSGIMDAAILLVARAGKLSEAMDKLVAHINTLESALVALLESPGEDSEEVKGGVRETLDAIQKYVQVGLWLCRKQAPQLRANRNKATTMRTLHASKDALNDEEMLWLRFIEAVVAVAKTGLSLDETSSNTATTTLVTAKLRSFVQQSFHPIITDPELSPSFLPILRQFLSRAAKYAPTLSSLRDVLASIFSTYTFESSLLSLAQTLLDQSLFFHIKNLTAVRARGWRPASQVCEACRERVWGPGVGGEIYEAWETRRRKEDMARSIRSASDIEGGSVNDKRKGKMAVTVETETEDNGDESSISQAMDKAIVVFVCRHVFHKKCLEKLTDGGGGEMKCLSCR